MFKEIKVSLNTTFLRFLNQMPVNSSRTDKTLILYVVSVCTQNDLALLQVAPANSACFDNWLRNFVTACIGAKPRKIDSLQQVADRQPDSLRVWTLTKLAREFRQYN